MDTKQLAERLRELAVFHRNDRRHVDGELCDEAADRIEQADRIIRASVVVGSKQRRANLEQWQSVLEGGV